MKGQWLGFFAGDLSGHMTIEVDERRKFQDVAGYIHVADEPRVLYFRSEAALGDSAGIKSLLGSKSDFEPNVPTDRETIDISYGVQDQELVVEFQFGAGAKCSAMLRRSQAHTDSMLPATRMSWAQFERYVRNIEPRRYIFRGQEHHKWRLRTSFHRSGRSNMLRYLWDDVRMMHQRVTNLAPEFVDIVGDPIRYAAFLALAQHHAYPTPMLDWTRSPFVAAFFAFRNTYRRSGRGGSFAFLS